ncbi:MAG: MFS transporter, partial [Chloroflexi bacterium]|nr:MFS transporter [Chloroflexota bacterium]
LQCVGVVTLALVSETWHIAPFVILYGLGLGATMPMRNSLVADYFGRRSLGTILGWLMSVTMVGSILSPVIAGWFFDVTGSYRLIFIIFALLATISVPAVLLARKPLRDH